MEIFFIVFITIFIAEMGDKSLLLLVALASKHKVVHILTGTLLATILLNLLAVTIGSALSQFLDLRIIKIISGIAFLFFALSILLGEGEEEDKKLSKKLHPIISIFCAYFISELGDKTQLSAITLSANYAVGSSLFINAFWVFLGCTFGLFLAGVIGLLVGLLLKSKMPTKLLNIISFLIFAFFGIYTLLEGFYRIFIVNDDLKIFKTNFLVWICTLLCAIIFLVVCLLIYFYKNKKKQKDFESILLEK